MPVIDIDHVQIAAPPNCESKAREFFGVLLGLQEIEKPQALAGRGGCWFRVGTRQLHVGVEPDFRPANKAHPAFGVDAIEELFGALDRAGVRCNWDTTLDSVKRFYAFDPWGNRLEFIERST